jgi:hypothetical protein
LPRSQAEVVGVAAFASAAGEWLVTPVPAGAWLSAAPRPAPDYGTCGGVSDLAWERALAQTDLTSAPAGLVAEHIAAGLFVCPEDLAPPRLGATARSVLPDPARATLKTT